MSDETPRLNLNTYEKGDTDWSHTDTVEALDERAIERGPVSERPASGDYDDELYYAVDQNVLWGWDESTSDWTIRGGTGSSEQPLDSVHTEQAQIKRYSGQVSQNGENTDVPSGERTEINFDAAEIDQLEEFDGTSRIVCSREATYHVRAVVKFSGSSSWSTGDMIEIRFGINGNTAGRNMTQLRKTGTGSESFVAHTVLSPENADLSEGDEISLHVEQDTGTTRSTRRFRRTRLEWWSA